MRWTIGSTGSTQSCELDSTYSRRTRHQRSSINDDPLQLGDPSMEFINQAQSACEVDACGNVVFKLSPKQVQQQAIIAFIEGYALDGDPVSVVITFNRDFLISDMMVDDLFGAIEQLRTFASVSMDNSSLLSDEERRSLLHTLSYA